MTRVLICLVFLTFAASFAIAQTQINPATTTVQFAGQPNPDGVVSNFTAPGGAVVLTGSAISAVTGKPIRYLWVGDGTFGLCRVDPEIDVPGTHSVNVNTCPFKLNGASITGGPLAYDKTNGFLYLADMRNSQGVFRMKYDPTLDSGNGGIDFTSIFAMAGNPTNARFQGGQTGCPLPLNTTLAAPPPTGAVDYVALGPDGNLWVGFKKSGGIMRINNPAAATSTGFGTCADFAQLVAITTDNKKTSGLVWLGHDLWGVDGTGPFVIPNADTTCQALGSTPVTSPTCVATPQFTAAAGANSVDGDQNYPALDGDNLYFGMGAPGNDFWVTAVSGGPATQQFDPSLMSFAQLAALLPTTPAFGNEAAMGVDRTDHANLMVFTGDDPSLVGAIGAGRWFETCQGNPPAPGTFNCPTPLATALPGIPTVVRAEAKDTSIQVSWTPAQAAQPVTSYIVRNTFASNNILLADRVITPGASGFPDTTVSITGDPVVGATYAFSVAEVNGFGTAPFSAQSNTTLAYPQISKPGIPTNLTAGAGNQAAFVTWMPPANQGGAPIVSYTVTALANNVITPIQQTVGQQGPGLNSATVPGLTNGTSYTFTVHADNGFGAGHSGMESTPSNAVVPSASPILVVNGSGPTSLTITPTQVTYNFTIQNISIFAVNSVVATDKLLTGDGAFIVLAQPSQGTCNTGGVGTTTLVCNLGSMNSGATATVNVIVQIQGAGVTDTLNVTALDNASVTQTGSAAVTTVPPPPPSSNISTAVTVTGNAQVPNPNIGQAGNIVWTVSNTTQTAAPNVIFDINVPAGLQLNSITLTINNGGTFLCSFTPTGGVAQACPGNFNTTLGGVIHITTPSLGGSTKNGAKPPQTMITTVNVTPPAATAHGAVFNSTGTMTFGPGGVDTLPNSATVRITVR